MRSGFQTAATDFATYLRRDIGPDLVAGLTGATAGAPQAMAFAILAGISPVYGLYTAIVATIISSLFGRSTFMTSGPTNALAVVVGSTLAPFANSGDLIPRLVTLTFLVGVFQFGLGVLRMGGLTRYVSRAVMTGFITGAASLVILGQLSELTSIPASSDKMALRRAAALVGHLDALNWPTLVTGMVTMMLIVLLHRTRLHYFATLIAIVVTGFAVAVLGWESQGVSLVRDISTIPSKLPGVMLPEPAFAGEMALPALALAVLGLVQTSALAAGLDEPEGHAPDASREFVGQGAGNLVGAFFQGMPAGGSLSRTAVNIKSGARTRWSNVWAGVFVALIMLSMGGLAERIALAALAGHLVVAASTLIKPADIVFVWRASWTGRTAMIATFVSTLVLPLQYSVYVGVALSLALYVFQSSSIRITRLQPVGRFQFREVPVPDSLPEGEPIIIAVQGHLYFAAMHNLHVRLPHPNGERYPVVILRLRGDRLLAGTGTAALVDYARELRARHGKLILCGVEQPILDTLQRTGALSQIGPENVFVAGEVLLASLQEALDYANTWLDKRRMGPAAYPEG
ncbi:MAG: SulP family inorganic anion transporter [Chloroflexi bacterium]|nr:SulP family inorganic anion transporter [Chloroflexota bacterium]